MEEELIEALRVVAEAERRLSKLAAIKSERVAKELDVKLTVPEAFIEAIEE